MGLALSGLASGFDWKSVVDQIDQLNRAPQNRLRVEKKDLASKETALNEIKSMISNLKTSAAALGSEEALLKKATAFQSSSTTWSSSATKDTPVGQYQIQLLSAATTTSLAGSGTLSPALNPASPLSGLSVGRAITAGNFTVNGVAIAISTTDTLDDVLGKITGSGAGVTASYDPATDRINLSGASAISLGAPNDTSNFLQAMRLTSGGALVQSSGPGLSVPKINVPINSANLNWAGVPPGVQPAFKINGEAIGYDPATDTIQTLLARINNSPAGVSATFDLASGGFSIRSKTTGNVGISITDDVGGLAAAMGLTTGTLTAGADAQFSVNGGGTLTSRSNVLDESSHGIPGLSVTANQPGTETINISADTAATKSAIDDFISKYNAVQNTIDRLTKVTTSGEKVTAAVLAGNREVADISRSLRRVLYEVGSGVTGGIQRITDLGIDFAGIENTISITKSSVLDSKLANDADDVASFFNTASTGLVGRLDALLDRLVSDSGTAQGSLKTQFETITTQNKSLDRQIEFFERQLAAQRAQLEASFIAMERAQASYQQQGAYLSKTFGSSK
jgi:flagellar hook-associated protein 2